MSGVLLTTVGLAQPSRHMFGAQGGTFGRSRKCDWVLADPECILSSLHGRIAFANGTFLLLDESTNGIFVENSREPLGRGRSVIVNDGLRFRIGGYQIEARLVVAQAEPAATRADPFQAAPQAHNMLLPHEQQAQAALRQGSDYGDLWSSKTQDPLAYLDSPSTLMQQQSPQLQAPRMQIPQPIVPPPAAGQARGMDTGFGLDTATYYPQAVPPVPLQAQPAFAPPTMPAWPEIDSHAPGRDTGFGMPRALAIPVDLPVAMPVAPSPIPVPVAPSIPTPSIPAAAGKLIPDDFDPFRSLVGSTARAPAAMPASVTPPVPQAMPIMPGPMPLPVAVPPAPANSAIDLLGPDLLADVVKIEAPQVMNGKAVAVDKPFDPLEALKSRREERMASLQRRAERPLQLPEPALADLPADFALPVAAVAAPRPAQPVTDDVVLHALLRGMGIDGPKASGVDAVRLAEDVGAMVKVVAEGLVQLLSARQMLKSEFRMDETQVRPEENNPFKYFKMAELVLDELFVTRSGGFQPAPEAAGAAIADLQQHVMLMTSAMQRGMALMFQRLDPESVTRSSGGDGGMRIRGLGGAVKGKWETYVETYGRMSGQLDSITKQTVSEALSQVLEERARNTSSEY